MTVILIESINYLDALGPDCALKVSDAYEAVNDDRVVLAFLILKEGFISNEDRVFWYHANDSGPGTFWWNAESEAYFLHLR